MKVLRRSTTAENKMSPFLILIRSYWYDFHPQIGPSSEEHIQGICSKLVLVVASYI